MLDSGRSLVTGSHIDDGSDKEAFSEPIKRKLASAISGVVPMHIYSEGKKGNACIWLMINVNTSINSPIL